MASYIDPVIRQIDLHARYRAATNAREFTDLLVRQIAESLGLPYEDLTAQFVCLAQTAEDR